MAAGVEKLEKEIGRRRKESKAWKREKEEERKTVWKARKSYKQSQERTTLQPRAKRINGGRNACKHRTKVTRVFQYTFERIEVKNKKNNLLLFIEFIIYYSNQFRNKYYSKF